MRVLVACQRLGTLDARAVGRLLAGGWADLGATVAVVPMAVSGAELQEALDPAGVHVVVPPSRDGGTGWRESSAPLGDALTAAQAGGGCVALDLTRRTGLDAGAGLLGTLGAIADVDLSSGWHQLSSIGRLDLAPATWPGSEVIGVVDPAEISLPLGGLRGISSLRGRELGVDPAEMLAADAALSRFAVLAGVDPATPGAGAGGGAGCAVLALGGRLVTGPQLCAERVGLEESLAVADLIVTACPSLDIGNHGGPVVRYLADRAAAAEVPTIVFSPQVAMGGRELRTIGIEAAYALPPEPDAVKPAVARVAVGWAW